MGQEIVYCFKCQKRVLGSDFAKGMAYQVGNNISCSACAADLLQTLNPREREQLLAQMFKATRDRQGASALSHGTSPAAAPSPSRSLSSSSTRTKPVTEGTASGTRRSTTSSIPIVRPPPRVAARRSTGSLIAGILVAAVVLFAGILLALGGGRSGGPPSEVRSSDPDWILKAGLLEVTLWVENAPVSGTRAARRTSGSRRHRPAARRPSRQGDRSRARP